KRILRGLELSKPRAEAASQLVVAIDATKLFDGTWAAAVRRKLCSGAHAKEAFVALAGTLDSLESVLRVRDGLKTLTPPLASATESLIGRAIPSDRGIPSIRKAVLAAEITRRLRHDPKLQSIDGQRIKTSFERYRALDADKKELARDAILHFWTSRH